MLEKWKQRAVQMNFRKVAALYGKFSDRMERLEPDMKINREYPDDEIGDGEHPWEEHRWKEPYISMGDVALIACYGIIGAGLVICYWLLCMIWAYRKSHRMGVNSGVWVLAALCLNLVAIAVLYLYSVWKGTCSHCGRIRSGGRKYCDRCGEPLLKECPDCGQTADMEAAYCGHCGKKLDEKEEV